MGLLSWGGALCDGPGRNDCALLAHALRRSKVLTVAGIRVAMVVGIGGKKERREFGGELCPA